MKRIICAALCTLMIMVTAPVHAKDDVVMKVCAYFSTDLEYGLSDAEANDEVSYLQYVLRTYGYLDSEPTGYFGPMTFAAVRKFQHDNRISPTSGIVGPLTRKLLNERTCVAEEDLASVADPDAPSILLSGKSGKASSTQSITVEVGDTFQISGTPKNLKGERYGKRGFTATWFFDRLLDDICTTDSKLKPTSKWTLKCTAEEEGVANVYVEIYKDGETYPSNWVEVNIVED